jgi:hypothetical protein
MVALVLNHRIRQDGAVRKRKGIIERALEAHLLMQTALRSIVDRLSGTRMAAARVRPQRAGMILVHVTLLKEKPPLRIEYEYRERPVQPSLFVSLKLVGHAHGFVLCVYQNDFSRHINGAF